MRIPMLRAAKSARDGFLIMFGEPCGERSVAKVTNLETFSRKVIVYVYLTYAEK